MCDEPDKRKNSQELKLSILLFGEIEKSSDALWQFLLGMLDKATLTLGDNRRVNLSQTIIFDAEPWRRRDHGNDGGVVIGRS